MDKENKSKTLRVRWYVHVCHITYNSNGGIFNSHSDDKTQECYYGTNCNLRTVTGSGSYFKATRTGYSITASNAWSSSASSGTTYSQASGKDWAQEICSGLGNGSKKKTLFANWHR